MEPIVRIGIDYTFDELFGRAEVRYCFPVGQLVVLENRFVLPVERLGPGMRMRLEDGHVATVTKIDGPKVWGPPSRTPTADGRYARRVLGTIKRIGFAVFDLIAGGQSVTTTPGHPFWSVDRQGWVGASELRVGERLRAGDGSTVPVDGISPLRRELIELYNIEVEEFHTYFVGNGGRGGVLAHNGLDGGCGIPKPASPGNPHVPSGPLQGKRVGHTFSKHGSHNTHELASEAMNSGRPVGQWVDDAAAEQFIASKLPELGQGPKTFDLPPGLGRQINPDGSFVPATKATLVPSKTGVKTGYPFAE